MIGALVAVFAIAIGAAAVITRKPARRASGPIEVSLRGMVAAGSPPQMVRGFQSGAALKPGESLLLRAHLSRAAHLRLLAQQPGSASEPIWPDADGEQEAGDFQIGDGDHPLSLAQPLFAGGAALLLLACDRAPAADSLRSSIPFTSASAPAAFPACATALLTLGPAAR